MHARQAGRHARRETTPASALPTFLAGGQCYTAALSHAQATHAHQRTASRTDDSPPISSGSSVRLPTENARPRGCGGEFSLHVGDGDPSSGAASHILRRRSTTLVIAWHLRGTAATEERAASANNWRRQHVAQPETIAKQGEKRRARGGDSSDEGAQAAQYTCHSGATDKAWGCSHTRQNRTGRGAQGSRRVVNWRIASLSLSRSPARTRSGRIQNRSHKAHSISPEPTAAAAMHGPTHIGSDNVHGDKGSDAGRWSGGHSGRSSTRVLHVIGADDDDDGVAALSQRLIDDGVTSSSGDHMIEDVGTGSTPWTFWLILKSYIGTDLICTVPPPQSCRDCTCLRSSPSHPAVCLLPQVVDSSACRTRF